MNPMPAIRRDFKVRYLVESFEPLEKAAEVIAGRILVDSSRRNIFFDRSRHPPWPR